MDPVLDIGGIFPFFNMKIWVVFKHYIGLLKMLWMNVREIFRRISLRRENSVNGGLNSMSLF